MSNRRKPRTRNTYRTQFLPSPAWRARHARWFRTQSRLGCPLRCAGCDLPATEHQLELHHVTYSGVQFASGSWRAFEHHSDLVPLHPYCHGMLHQIIEHDRVLAHHRGRRAASAIALNILRRKFSHVQETA